MRPSREKVDSTRPLVYLVGAGPGDPELLTIKGARALAEADVVLYDRLVNPEILEHAAKAVKIFAGKVPHEESSVRQNRIHQLMIEHARAGRTVVRLKGGDPCVFGRAGEETLALAAEGIAVEIIPGISAAIAGPALAGIPVTHRQIASSFAVFAGHESSGDFESSVDWDFASRAPTAVFLMGVERLPLIVEHLIKCGRPATTPVALVERASTSEQKVFSGTLGTILKEAKEARPPSVVIVGEVASIRERVHQLLDGAHP